MEILWFATLFSISIVAFIYFFALYLRPEYLRKRFITRANEFSPICKFDEIIYLSPFMKKDCGTIIECKLRNIVLYQSIQTDVLSSIWYIVVIKKTNLSDGIYGCGYVRNTILDPRTFSEIKKLFQSTPVENVKNILQLNDSPECIEIFNGNAYIYYKCGSIFGSNAIEIGFKNI
jgi:hypothetical protein